MISHNSFPFYKWDILFLLPIVLEFFLPSKFFHSPSIIYLLDYFLIFLKVPHSDHPILALCSSLVFGLNTLPPLMLVLVYPHLHLLLQIPVFVNLPYPPSPHINLRNINTSILFLNISPSIFLQLKDLP